MAEPTHLIAPHDQKTDFVELFFDLVFVFAITKVTHRTAHHLDVAHVLQSVVLFWLIWWGWTQFTWALNSADTRQLETRIGTLVATAVAFVMAASTDTALAAGGLGFGVSYVAVRLMGLGLYLRVSRPEERVAVGRFAAASLLGLAAVAVGALVEPSDRVWWWSGAIALDMVAGYIGGKAQGWNLRVEHFVERHALIVIIALGESLIVAAGAVSSGARSRALMVPGGLALLMTCLLWWTYFSWVREHLEIHLAKAVGTAQTQVGRDAFSFMHFPVMCGIIGIAVAFEKILGHPADPMTLPIAAALGGGALLFLGATAASVWRSSGVVLLPRVAVAITSAAAVLFTVGRDPGIALVVVTGGISLVVGLEWRRSRESVDGARSEVT